MVLSEIGIAKVVGSTISAVSEASIAAAVSKTAISTIAEALVLVPPVKILSRVCSVFAPTIWIARAAVSEAATISVIPALSVVEAPASEAPACACAHALFKLFATLLTPLHRLLVHGLSALGTTSTTASAPTMRVIVFSVCGK